MNNQKCPDNSLENCLGPCPDKIAAELTINANECVFTAGKTEIMRKKICDKHLHDENRKIMCIVLESPHKDEFDERKKKNGISIPSPAVGATGTLFFKHFEGLIKKSKIYPQLADGYYIIFMNAVRMQASKGKALGKKHPDNVKCRDDNWLNFWNCRSGEQDFIERLIKYNPDVIINLCTKGHEDREKGEELQDFVERAIIKYKEDKTNKASETIITKGNHPSSWMGPRNRRID